MRFTVSPAAPADMPAMFVPLAERLGLIT